MSPFCQPQIVRRLTAHGLWASVAIIAALGCPQPTGESQSRPAHTGLDSQCSSDGECLQDEICHQSLCGLIPPHSTLTYGLVINPPNSTDIPAQDLGIGNHLSIDASLTAQPGGPITGQVLTSDGEPAPDGTLHAVGAGAPSPRTVQAPVRNGQFELDAVAGTYSLTYIVDDRRWPRIPLQDHELSASSPAPSFEIPQFEQLRTVTGELVRQATELIDILDEPVEGAEIVARGATTGYRSQVAITDEEGNFVLRLPPGEDTFDISVHPSKDNPLVPQASFADEIDATTDDISISLGELNLDLLSLALELTVEPVDDHNPEWADYRVILRRSVDVGQLLVSPEIDDRGIGEIELPAGFYEIEITTPPDAPWGSITEEVNIIEGLGDLELELPRRHRVDATVTDFEGQSLEGARIAVETAGSTGPLRPPVRSDANGFFELWMEPGSYIAAVRPHSSSGLPISRHQFSVPDDPSDSSLQIEIPRGFVASGRLQTPEGTPISDTSIRAVDGEQPENIIGESTTDTDGVFRFVFPFDTFE